MSFKVLYRSGYVKRWHVEATIQTQNLAAHQWGVAMIIREICPGDIMLLEAALTHDCAEVVTGDIPFTAKRESPVLRAASELCEAEFNVRNKIQYEFELSKEQLHALAWADTFEALLFSQREIALGNQLMQDAKRNCMDAIFVMGHPNNVAEVLYKEMLNGTR